MYGDLSAEETFLRELPEPEQARVRRVCSLLRRRHELRGLPVLLFIVVMGALLRVEMEYHLISPLAVLMTVPFAGAACCMLHAGFVKHRTLTIWEFAQEEANRGGEEVRYALYKMAHEAPELVPNLAEFVKTFN
ncbi:MAG: hypothetical protein J5J00_06495 [Deltaproteobacteria bacterium]|nr:hypothetical protein [Deltaproteobacteria bacterium]